MNSMKLHALILISLVAALAVFAGCAAYARAPVTGFIASGVSGPIGVAGETDETDLVGRATAQSILGLIANGDASIQAAARSAGITHIHHVDYESTNILGIYATFTTIVYGTGPGVSSTGSSIDISEEVTEGTDFTVQPETITAVNLEWAVGPDVNTSFMDALEWVNTLGGGWSLPTVSQLESLYASGISTETWGAFENSGQFVWANAVEGDIASNYNFLYGQVRQNARSYSSNGRAFAVRSPRGS